MHNQFIATNTHNFLSEIRLMAMTSRQTMSSPKPEDPLLQSDLSFTFLPDPYPNSTQNFMYFSTEESLRDATWRVVSHRTWPALKVSGFPPWSTWCLVSFRTFARTSHAPAQQPTTNNNNWKKKMICSVSLRFHISHVRLFLPSGKSIKWMVPICSSQYLLYRAIHRLHHTDYKPLHVAPPPPLTVLV
jgi:hypothetical protein